MRQAIKTDKAPVAIGPYSQGLRAGNYIFVAGQGARDPRTGSMQGTTVQEQTRQTLENVKAILDAEHATLKDVVKVTIVLKDLSSFGAMNEVYGTFFSEPFPARTTFGGQLPMSDMLVEIEAIAFVGK